MEKTLGKSFTRVVVYSVTSLDVVVVCLIHLRFMSVLLCSNECVSYLCFDSLYFLECVLTELFVPVDHFLLSFGILASSLLFLFLHLSIEALLEV